MTDNVLPFPGYLVSADQKTFYYAGKIFGSDTELADSMTPKEFARVLAWEIKRVPEDEPKRNGGAA